MENNRLSAFIRRFYEEKTIPDFHSVTSGLSDTNIGTTPIGNLYKESFLHKVYI